MREIIQTTIYIYKIIFKLLFPLSIAALPVVFTLIFENDWWMLTIIITLPPAMGLALTWWTSDKI